MSELELRAFRPCHGYFIGIDSDGCVFDSMEIKQKECFTPMFIKHFGLQAVSRYARETWEFVNLYSKTRGVNRYRAVVRALRLLGERREVAARGVRLPSTAELEEWISRESKLSNAALDAEIQRGNKALLGIQAWSNAVNAQIEDIVSGVPPFPWVKASLEKMQDRADVAVISQTPVDALDREWAEHQLRPYVRLVAGAEMGTKSEHLKYAAAGKYPGEKILMIGDAPGDRMAARHNGARFYPIMPGVEEASWERFHHEALDRFFQGTYAGDYEESLIAEFEASLPESPPWAA